MKRIKVMKMTGALLLILMMMLIPSCKCGKDAAEKQSSTAQTDTEQAAAENIKPENDTEENNTENNEAESITPEDNEAESTASEEQEDEKGASVHADQAMLEIANTNIQTYANTMAFDEEYIYFVANSNRYRCHYDGSDVQKLEKNLNNVVAAEGKLWGYWGVPFTGDPYGIYCMEPETGAMTTELEFSEQEKTVSSILVSGNWMCYAGEAGTALVIRDLATGQEKTVMQSASFGNQSDISMCLYGNTLYALINTSQEEGKYVCTLCTYELGSNAETMTELCKDLTPGAIRATVWMEDGILLLDKSEGSQFYYARFADIDDGTWNYRREKNKIGPDISEMFIGFQMGGNSCARYVLGNDLLLITSDDVIYIKNFDPAETQHLDVMEDHSFVPASGIERCHGMHDGCVYIYTQDEISEDYEIVKISEGGNVEHISTGRPKP